MSQRIVFVCGATGTLGGAVARQLRALDWGVHTITRNLDSEAAKALISIGVQVSKGDFEDVAVLRGSLAGCQAVFINTCPTPEEFRRELHYATNILCAARSAGVQHVLYSSGVQVQAKEGFISKVQGSKLDIEEATKTAGIKYWTILRPAIFMANYILPKIKMYPGATETGQFNLAVAPETIMPIIDHEDVAKFVVTAFYFPDKFHGRKLDLAGQYPTSDELLNTIQQASGKPIRGNYHSEKDVLGSGDLNPFFEAQLHLRKMANLMDQDDAKAAPVVMTTFSDFLKREKKLVNQTYQNVAQ